MEKERLTDDEINIWAQKLLIQLVAKVDIRDRQKVIGRIVEIEMAHVDGMLATLRASKPVTEE